MGGFGSGRWAEHRKAWAVEDCRRVVLARVVGTSMPVGSASGTLRWLNDRAEEAASAGYELVAGEGGGLTLRLRYRRAGGADPVVLNVALERGALPRGGHRWSGRCPLGTAGRPCRRRVRGLYLPPGAAYSGCRTCHRLSYRSRQEHDPRVTRLVRDPAAVARLSRDIRGAGVARLGLLLKALTILEAGADREHRRAGRKPLKEVE